MCLDWWLLVSEDSKVNFGISLSGEPSEPCGEFAGLDDSGAGGLPLSWVCQMCNDYSLGCCWGGPVLDEWINIQLILPTTILEHVFQIKFITQVPVSKPVVKRLARLHHILFKVCSHLHPHSHLGRVLLRCSPQEVHSRSDTAHQIRRWQGQPLRSGPERVCVMWSSPVVPPPLIHFSPQGIQADLHSFACSTHPWCPLSNSPC